MLYYVLTGHKLQNVLFLNNEPCLVKPTLIDLNPYELYSYPIMSSLDRCNWNLNTLDGLSSKICDLNKPEDIDLHILNMIARINKSKT